MAGREISRDHARAITLLAKETSVEATQEVEAALVDVARQVDALRFSTELRTQMAGVDARRSGDGKDESAAKARRRLTLVQLAGQA